MGIILKGSMNSYKVFKGGLILTAYNGKHSCTFSPIMKLIRLVLDYADFMSCFSTIET